MKILQKHERSLSMIGRGTSIKSGGIKLVILVQTPLSEMTMRHELSGRFSNNIWEK